MNQHGNVAFNANATIGGQTSYGTFRWDYQARKVTAVAVIGTPAGNNLTLVDAGNNAIINNNDEIAFGASVKDAAGMVHGGVFFLGQDGRLQGIALPDQVLPDGSQIQDAFPIDLNDAGAVTFLTVRGNGWYGAYLWEKGTITTLAVAGQDIPGAGKIASFDGAWVNNHDHSVLVQASLQGNASHYGLYRFANSSLTPVVVPGQDMDGGGKLLGVGVAGVVGSVSAANDAGQRAFIGVLQGNRSVYLLDADGKVSLVLNTGASTDLGKVTSIDYAVSLNNKGQIALNVWIGGGSAETIVLLSPTTPDVGG
jgi:hypothetical protein